MVESHQSDHLSLGTTPCCGRWPAGKVRNELDIFSIYREHNPQTFAFKTKHHPTPIEYFNLFLRKNKTKVMSMHNTEF